MSDQEQNRMHFRVIYPDSAGQEHADFDSMRRSEKLLGRLDQLEAVKSAPGSPSPLSSRAEAGYLAVIAALSYALAECLPELRKDGRPFVGYSKATGDAGIVGHLKQNNYTERSSTDLEKKISDALKQAALSQNSQ